VSGTEMRLAAILIILENPKETDDRKTLLHRSLERPSGVDLSISEKQMSDTDLLRNFRTSHTVPSQSQRE
jgi:hypothetical protein